MVAGGAGNAIAFTGGSNVLVFEGATSGLTGAISNGGTSLTFDQAVTSTLASAITGSGAVIKTGVGTLTLSGVSTYAGSTSVNAGTLAISSYAGF